jgi:hypothetical protein
MTTEQKHTPAPWKLKKYGVIIGGVVRQYVNGDSQDQIALACALDYDNGDQEANGRRIVACVNACEGIPTDHLENFGLPPFDALAAKVKEFDAIVIQQSESLKAAQAHFEKLSGEIKELEAQRDEMFTAVEFLSKWDNNRPLPRDMYELVAKIKAEKQNEAIK